MKMKKSNPLNRIARIGGLLLLAAALLLAGHNLWQQAQSNQAAQDALSELNAQLDDTPQAATETPAIPSKAATADATDAEETPAYVENPEMEMPVMMASSQSYIGILELPALGLTLPVLSDWDYQKLEIAPCRYYGSAYQSNMIIAAHNYSAHFGKLDRLKSGDTIRFTDFDGNVFTYKVETMERLNGTAVESMTSGEWDLTLFTCTLNGQARVTVRCNLVDDSQ